MGKQFSKFSNFEKMWMLPLLYKNWAFPRELTACNFVINKKIVWWPDSSIQCKNVTQNV